MSSAPAMEADKARLSSVFPFPFCVPSSSPSTVFPPMFNAGFHQMYQNFFQQQILQLAQQQSPALAPDVSPSMSERTSSRGESPAAVVKKLNVDDSGNPLCPLCGDRLPETEWAAHVELEKNRILSLINGLRAVKNCEPSTASEQPRKKRELELHRIRNNHMKRLSLKRGVLGIRDSLTPFSRQSADDSGSSTSPEIKKEEDSFVKCSSCSRVCEFAIVTSSSDSPRCPECFERHRSQSTTLDLSCSPPAEKKPRIEAV